MKWLIRALKHAMAFFCLSMALVLLMAVVAVAEGDMSLQSGVIWFLICVLSTNFALGIWFRLDDKEHMTRSDTMSNLPDAPYIRNLQNTGYRDGKDPKYPTCPICYKECSTIYISSDNEIVGCDQCMTECDAWEVTECFGE